MTKYDFDYDANIFPTHRDMFMCLRDRISSSTMQFTEQCSAGYNALFWSDSILNETLEEVHMRELKRFIRSKVISRDEALNSLIQVVCEGSRYPSNHLVLIKKMLVYIITEDTNNKRPNIPYSVLFDSYYIGNATLEDEVKDGGYHMRGPLIDIIASYYLNFDASSYADWASIPSNHGEPDDTKKCDDPERFQYIKANSKYLQNL